MKQYQEACQVEAACGIHAPSKNSLVTSGCLSCINVTKECYQIGLSNEVLFLVNISISSEDLFGSISTISTTVMQQRNSSIGRCVRSKQTRNFSWFIYNFNKLFNYTMIWILSTLWTSCMCHTHTIGLQLRWLKYG